MSGQDDVAATPQASGRVSAPAEMLEWAAQRLLELSSDPLGNPPKWWMDCRPARWGQHTDWEICGRGKPLFVATTHATVSDMEWVTVMSPSVAMSLVAWLRQAALAYRMGGDNTQDENALRFAELLYGEARAEGKERSDP